MILLMTHAHQIVMCNTSTMADNCWVAGRQPAGRGNKHPLGAVGGLSCALVSQRLHQDYFCCDCQSLSSLFHRGHAAADLLRASHVSAEAVRVQQDGGSGSTQLLVSCSLLQCFLFFTSSSTDGTVTCTSRTLPAINVSLMPLLQKRCSHYLKYAHT